MRMQVGHGGFSEKSLGDRRQQPLGDVTQFIFRVQGTTPDQDANILAGIQN